MRILWLEPSAQVVVLQAFATYAALASAYFFARPVLRGQTLQSNRDLLNEMTPDDPDVKKLVKQAASILNDRNQKNAPLARSDNTFGVILLGISILLFTVAVVLQIVTDPQFRSGS